MGSNIKMNLKEMLSEVCPEFIWLGIEAGGGIFST
jgi:hypothetical protein